MANTDHPKPFNGLSVADVEQLKRDLTESIHRELQERNGGTSVLTRVAVWAGLLVSLSTLGLFLWRGGALANTLERTVADQALLVAKVATLESSSTVGAREFMAADNARQKETEARLARLETAVMDLAQIKSDVAVMKAQVNDIVLTIRATHQGKANP